MPLSSLPPQQSVRWIKHDILHHRHQLVVVVVVVVAVAVTVDAAPEEPVSRRKVSSFL
jgi:hypothetical protein